MLLAMPTAFAHTRCISPSVCLLKSFMQASTSLLRGRRGRSRAVLRFAFGEHRGAENALNLPLRHATIKMCRDPWHTFIFHVPEGRASYAEGVLHVPQACFICGALRAHRGAQRRPRQKKLDRRIFPLCFWAQFTHFLFKVRQKIKK